MSTTPVGNNPNPLSWLAVLNEVNGTTNASEAQQVSTSNRSVTFTSDMFGESISVTLNIPDDLDLPAEVTPDAINDLLAKLVDSKAISNYGEFMIVQDSIQKVYSQMAAALADTHSNSTGQVLFDLYQLMALLVEVAQSQRDASRDLRSTENQQIQNSIQAQADEQRAAALTGLIVGVTCGALSAIFSMAMMVGQGISYKGQINATRSSGMDAAQNKVSMLRNADTPEHAQAQLSKVTSERGMGTEMQQRISNEIQHSETVSKARFNYEVAHGVEMAKNDVTAAKTPEALSQLEQANHNVETAQNELTRASEGVNGAVETEMFKVTETRSAAEAKQAYENACDDVSQPKDETLLAKYDRAITAEQNLAEAKAAVADHPITKAQARYDSMKASAAELGIPDFEKARTDYRAALELEADKYAAKYEGAVSRGASKSEVDAARKDMRMARAIVNNELMKDPALQSTPTEYQKSLGDAMVASDSASQRLQGNIDYRQSLHRIEVFSGMNAINTAIGNMLMGMTQNISSMIGAEATRDGAETKMAEEQLDQTKDLFQQAQTLVNAAVQMMQAVRQAEAQSMRDAIQA